MANTRIPKFNEEFDPKLFRFIFLKKLPLIIILFVLFFLSAFLMLRYTQPVFEANTIIQIETENKAEKIFAVNRFSDEQFSQKLELLKSRVFTERVLSKLPLDVSYYNEGKFLNHELYTSSPFSVNYVVYNPAIYSSTFKLVVEEDLLLSLSYTVNNGVSDETVRTELVPGQWKKLKDLELVIFLNLDNPDSQEALEKQKYFLFYIHQPEDLYDKYISNINLIVLNEVAKTIQISVRDNNPSRASDIANEIASEFQIFDIERKSMSANNILDFIDTQLETVLEELTAFEDSIVGYKKKYNIDTIVEIQRQSSLTQLNALEIELVEIQMESNILKNILEELTKKETPDTYVLLTILAGSQYQSILQSDLAKLSELTQKKDQMLLHSPENSSFIVSIEQQIKLQKNLTVKSVQSIKNNTDIRLQELTKRYNTQYGKAFVAGQEAPHFELKRIERLYTITEQFYNQLIEKKTEFSILKAGYVPENIILEKAKPQGSKVFPSQQKVLLITFLLAFFISLILVAIQYLRYNEIISASEISKYTNVPVLGVLPKYPSNIPIQQFIVEKYPKSIIAESLRAIRSNLQFIGNAKGSKVVAITSTISGEGKTFLAINLAGALAITGKKVIIIDVDMRKPTIHKFFNLQNAQGMSTILSGQSEVEGCIQDIGKYDIKFITAGPIPPNPAELLNDDRFENLINSLRKQYDYIIIDNPPIGLVSDALKSMQLADYPIYILRANYSKRNFLSLPEKMLQVYHIDSISIVLNGYDNTISNVGMEKDLVYAYGYVKGYRKGLKNTYYEQDIKPTLTIWERIKGFFKRDE